MRAGVLFCGGCNSYFDREEVYEQLKRKYPDRCEFSLYKPGMAEKFDITVLINGCTSECLMDDAYSGRLFVVNNLNSEKAGEQFDKILTELEN